ncbi:hypothetical protein M407DRAFT_242598 [Tulasnella calospora MUT 4182]|uniref:Uncharacterized protein n=1 Tax=Tulasnella calospora MUT 4182 TaxID=1051891 RepID=A0A0C3QPZ3_9AGAM|nr:hypothetical protein M407DRAFT_242598 [Tulasnella calospora MUT 4182]
MANAQQTPAARASSEYPGHPVPTQLNHPTLPMSNGLSNMLANRSVASGSGSRVQTLM